MAPQYDGTIATKGTGSSKYVREVTLGPHTIGVYYPEPATFRHDTYIEFIEGVSSVPSPPPEWERDLSDAVRSLQDPKHNVGNIIMYLPVGTLIEYPPNGQNPGEIPLDQIPVRVGITEEVVGADLERVVAVVELWLKRKLESPQ